MTTAQFEPILHSLRELVAVLDRDGAIAWCNAPLASALGLPPGHAEGEVPPVRWLLAPSTPPLLRALLAVETGLMPVDERVSLPLSLRGPDGGSLPVLGSVQALPASPAGLRRFLLLARPTGPRAETNPGLLPSQADFLANISHELRTPLLAILGNAELLKRTAPEDAGPDHRQRVDDILDGGRQLLGQIDDILEYAKAGSGRMTVRVEDLDVVEEVTACLQIAQGLAVGRKLVIEGAIDGSPGIVRTDGRLLRQIVTNLLGNAVKFTADGGRIQLAARRREPWLELAVRDTGIGIADPDAERIFSPFFQVDSTASRRRGGLGLGLALVRRFLELLGGGIKLRSKPGLGSTFIVYVPLDPRARQAEVPSAPGPLPEDEPGYGGGAPAGGAVAGLALLVGIASLLGAGCPPAEDPPPDEELPALHDPTAWGPYAVGSRTELYYDAARDRELTLELWYPAEAGTGGTPAFTFSVAGIEATVDPAGAPFPILGFSHGNGGMRQQSLFLTEFLASHGYLVVAPDHPNNNVYDGVDMDPEVIAQVAYDRPGDISAALDFAASLDGTPDQLLGMLDTERMGVLGHSFGAWTSVMLAGATATASLFGPLPEGAPPPPWQLGDPRIRAAVAMTPGGYGGIGDDGLADLVAPVLYMAGSLDETLPPEQEARPLYEGSPAPAALLTVEGAGHFTFSNLCQILEDFGDGCGEGFIPSEEAFPIVDAYSAAWVGRWVRGDERYEAWLEPGAGLDARGLLERRD
jgi:signal transduction histidine kinase/predicted dienelactone hydrolase